MSDDEGNCDTTILLENSPDHTPDIRPTGDGHSQCQTVVLSRCKSPVVLIASLIAAVGGLLFGYDVGIVSGALLQLEKEWHLNCTQKQLVVSSMLFGALAASCAGGVIIDKIGRKWTIIINSLIFILGAVILAVSFNFPILIIGRIIVGFSVALSAISECIYISEIAPPNKRGLLVSLNELGITVGFLLAYLMNYVLADLTNGWRYMFGASALPAFIQVLGMLFLPASPHYLMLKRREQEAQEVLSHLRGEEDVRQELTNIRIALESEMDQRCMDVITSQGMKYRFFIAIGLVLFQQFTGQPNVLYYASVIFESVGFCSEKDATFASVILGATKLVATGMSMLLVDKAGRRFFLLLGATFMAWSISSLGFIALAHPTQFRLSSCSEDSTFLTVPHINKVEMMQNGSVLLNETYMLSSQSVTKLQRLQTNGLTLSSVQLPFNKSSISNSSEPQIQMDQMCGTNFRGFSSVMKWCAVTSLLIYVASYSIGFGPVTWLILSEIFPTSIKGRALALASVLNWGANILVSSTFLDVMRLLSIGMTFLIYGLLCFFSVIFIFLIVPETKNKPLHRLAKEIEQSNVAVKMAHNFKKLYCCRYNNAQRYHQVSSSSKNTVTETTA